MHSSAHQLKQNPEQDLKKELQAIGRKLALLLQTANIPEEAKQAWADLVPTMTLEQIDRLIKILEQHILGASETEQQALNISLAAVQKNYEHSLEEAQRQTENSFAEIEQALKEP